MALVYGLRRIVEIAIVAAIASVLIFALLRALPGDPAVILTGGEAATDTAVAAARERWGLDESLAVQYQSWLANMLSLDPGTSYVSGQSVGRLVARALPASLELGIAALFFASVVGMATGAIAAMRPNRLLDNVIQASNAVILGVPNFWIGILLIMLMSLYLGVLPTGGRVPFTEDPVGAARHLFLPAVALGSTFIPIMSRFVRGSLLDVFSRDFMVAARAKGIPQRRVIFSHGVRNAALPVLTVVGIQAGRFIGGSVVIESVFAWPGLGRLLLQSIETRDYLVLQALLLVFVLLILLINLLVDFGYAVADPRVAFGTSHDG